MEVRGLRPPPPPPPQLQRRSRCELFARLSRSLKKVQKTVSLVSESTTTTSEFDAPNSANSEFNERSRSENASRTRAALRKYARYGGAGRRVYN